ncbi:hypothetical protein SLE2022_259040 [Rubroshorea leprosula]
MRCNFSTISLSPRGAPKTILCCFGSLVDLVALLSLALFTRSVANIIFLDQPVGTGFSYATSPEAYNVSDTLAAAQIFTFLKKWFIVHTNFLTNPLYISGDSYSGISVPLVVELISNGNEVGHYPPLNLQILEPKCAHKLHPKPNITTFNRRSLIRFRDSHPSTSKPSKRWCRYDNYVFSYIWANDKTVQRALHIREGTKEEWLRCNRSLSYTYDILSTVEYHRNLSKKAYLALIYSGDHDIHIPYVGTNEWIESLNLTIADEWRPWFVQGQVAGYTKMYKQERYYLTFATVKGGGHTAPEYNPEQCLAMIDRWLSHYPL